MIDWINEAEYVHKYPRDTWLLVRGRSMAIDRMLDVVGNDSIVSAYSQDEMVLAILLYNEFLGVCKNPK